MTSRLACCVLVALLAVAGCTPSAPPLPPSADTAAVADAIGGEGGRTFLSDITSYAWDDEGRSAGDLFAWIPRDAGSADTTAATRAGTAAQSIASFVAETGEPVEEAPANPTLWQAYTAVLLPYAGAMVGDDVGVAGFEPLDGIETPMPKTAALFGAIAERDGGLAAAADLRAQEYERAFAKRVVAEPPSATGEQAQRDLLAAARLRALVDRGSEIADPDSESINAGRAGTRLAFEIASLTARRGDPAIDPRYFGADGKLLSQNDISEDAWSLYDSQLTVFLADNQPAIRAIAQYGRAYQRIADQ